MQKVRLRWRQCHVPLFLTHIKADSAWGREQGRQRGHCRVLKSDFANLTILPEAKPTSDIPSSFCLNI